MSVGNSILHQTGFEVTKNRQDFLSSMIFSMKLFVHTLYKFPAPGYNYYIQYKVRTYVSMYMHSGIHYSTVHRGTVHTYVCTYVQVYKHKRLIAESQV